MLGIFKHVIIKIDGGSQAPIAGGVTGMSAMGIIEKRVTAGSYRLMDVAVASGRKGLYNYIELYNIEPEIKLGNSISDYFDSDVEDGVLTFFSRFLGCGDILHVEYWQDWKTRKELISGTPAIASRLGFKLFGLGFTWFKDWYIAEGGREGSLKLTAEKPLDEEMVRRNLDTAKKELEDYLKEERREETKDRAGKVLVRMAELMREPSVLLTPCQS